MRDEVIRESEDTGSNRIFRSPQSREPFGYPGTRRRVTPVVILLRPHRWTTLPGTNIAVLWQGEQPMEVSCLEGFWDLSPLVSRPGRVDAWARVVRDGRQTSPWPLLPVTRRGTYVPVRQPDSPMEN